MNFSVIDLGCLSLKCAQPQQGFLRAYEAGLMPPACGVDDCQASCFTRCVSVQGLRHWLAVPCTPVRASTAHTWRRW